MATPMLASDGRSGRAGHTAAAAAQPRPVWQRAAGLTDADLDVALSDGTIIRTHVLRPTWHFVTAADGRWMLALTAPRVLASQGSYYRRYAFDEAVCVRSNALLADALAGGNQLTRRQVAAVLAEGAFA